jgi:hypothetical protein
MEHQLPTSKTDALALKHDVDYLLANGNELKTKIADWNAISSTDMSLQSSVMRVGLGLRSLLSLPFNQRQDGNELKGQFLKQYIKHSPLYQQRFKELKVDLLNW